MNNHGQGYTPEQPHQAPVSQELACPVGSIMNKFAQGGLSVSGVTMETTQIPSVANQHVAVVRAGITVQSHEFQGIGAAGPADIGGENNAQRLFDKASANALTNAAGLAIIAQKTHPIRQAGLAHSTTSGVQGNELAQTQYPQPPRKYDHNPKTKASPSQMKLISTLCMERNITESEAREFAGLPVNGPLNSPQAHQLIHIIKEKRRQ